MRKELSQIEKTLNKNKQEKGNKANIKSDKELIDNCQTEKRKNVEVERWCKCNGCKKMKTNRECLCCVEIDEIKYKKLSGMSQCYILLQNYLFL